MDVRRVAGRRNAVAPPGAGVYLPAMVRTAMLGLVMVVAGCSTSTGVQSSLTASLQVMRGPPWRLGDSTATAAPGDTLTLVVALADSTSISGTIVKVRAACATNVEVLQGTSTIATLPSPATCTDSVVTDTLGGVLSGLLVREFLWVVPSGLPAAQYTVRSDVLISPAATLARLLQVN